MEDDDTVTQPVVEASKPPRDPADMPLVALVSMKVLVAVMAISTLLCGTEMCVLVLRVVTGWLIAVW